jgi:hypothetical protein
MVTEKSVPNSANETRLASQWHSRSISNRCLHADVDIESVVADLSSHMHAAFAILLHADIGVGGKMIIVAFQSALKHALDISWGKSAYGIKPGPACTT